MTGLHPLVTTMATRRVTFLLHSAVQDLLLAIHQHASQFDGQSPLSYHRSRQYTDNYMSDSLFGSVLHHYVMTSANWAFPTRHGTANNRHRSVTFALGHVMLEHAWHTLTRVRHMPALHSDTGHCCASIAVASSRCTAPIGPPTSTTAQSIALPLATPRYALHFLATATRCPVVTLC